MTPGSVRERLQERPGLVVPVGTTEQHGPHLPLGCDTIIVERLADDLSAEFGILRAPTVEYGVHAPAHAFPGGASLRRRTLHRVMNELIESWEEGAGVREFVILTAQASDAHLEALSTIRTDQARVQVVDVFSLDFGSLLRAPGRPDSGRRARHVSPALSRAGAGPHGARAGLRGHARDARPLPAGAQPAAAAGITRLGRISQPRVRPKGGAAV